MHCIRQSEIPTAWGYSNVGWKCVPAVTLVSTGVAASRATDGVVYCTTVVVLVQL